MSTAPDGGRSSAGRLPTSMPLAHTVAFRGTTTSSPDIPACATSSTTHRSIHVAALPQTASHLILSVGGNDALEEMNVLSEPTQAVAAVLQRIGGIVAGFQTSYAHMLDIVLAEHLPVAVCTIYDPSFPDPALQQAAVTALSAFNDVITRATFAAGLPLIDLRLICDSSTDSDSG